MIAASPLQLPHEVWDAFVAGHPSGNLLQANPWGRLKGNFGWLNEIAVMGNPPVAGASLLYKRLPLALGTIAYIPRGPVVDWSDAALTQSTLALVERAARQHRAWALWIEPELFDAPTARARLAALGFQPAAHTIQPPRTIWVDLSGSEDAVLARMKQKTRYNIRLAARKGVTVRAGSVADVATFYALMQETGARDAFGIHSAAYYRLAMELFAPNEQVALLLAEVESEPVAGLMVFALGTKAWYFYGASSERQREKMPAYALQWAAMQWARGRGCTAYDLWGIPDADEATLETEFAQRNDGLWGVYRFKRGFGGQVTRYVGLWEKPLHPLYPLARRLWRRG